MSAGVDIVEPKEAIEHLQGPYVQQLDADGVIVGVSRQALEEVLAYITRLRSARDGAIPTADPAAVEAARRIVEAANGMNGSVGADRRAALKRLDAAMRDEYGIIQCARAYLSAATRIEGLLEGIETLKDMTAGWQPIETAPRDGTRILAHCGAEYRPPYAVRVLLWYDALQWEGEYGPDSGWILDLPNETIDAEFTERDPTHWLPLPDPPEETRVTQATSA